MCAKDDHQHSQNLNLHNIAPPPPLSLPPPSSFSMGTRIFYGPLHCRDVLPVDQEERLFGPLKAHQIQLTPRHPAPIAKEMFDTIKRGLIIEVSDLTPHVTTNLYYIKKILKHKFWIFELLTYFLRRFLRRSTTNIHETCVCTISKVFYHEIYNYGIFICCHIYL